jgi:hypothetical protein
MRQRRLVTIRYTLGTARHPCDVTYQVSVPCGNQILWGYAKSKLEALKSLRNNLRSAREIYRLSELVDFAIRAEEYAQEEINKWTAKQ